MTNKIAIVFGASGFLGSHVAEALSVDGYQVRLFDRSPSIYQRHDQEMIIGDIMNLDEVTRAAKDATVVYNFAAIADIDLDRLKQAVDFGYNRWMAGDRVLVRCQAGLNRSGLVTALILMSTGLDAETAIREIRKNRADIALFNNEYVTWLMTEGAAFVAPSPSQQAA